MSNDLSQPDWDPDILEFVRWVKAQSVIGTLGPVSAVNCPFMPLPRLETYLKDGNKTRRLLEALFPNRELPVGPEEIWRNCIKVFSILLLIGKGSFIQHFVEHDQLWDAKLPFLSRPRHFPSLTGDDNFFESFSETQWHFCPYVFRHNDINVQLEKECILPIIHKEQLGDGGSALTYKIKLHPAYDYLTPATHIRRDSSHRYANTYVLKTYHSRDAEEHYTSEVKAFKALIPGGSLGKSIIGFYGSFVQDGSYNILLEFADRGTLDHYLDTTSPPTTGEDVYKLWNALFNVIKALKSIHDVERIDPKDPPILQGWHQDVKPSNILVVSGNGGSRFDCEFKLADLGLSHFRRISPLHRSNSDKDTSGTRTYGAPECYRFDEFMEHGPLYVKQSVDVWSLGCVYSEVAVWVVHGKDYLEEYRKMRHEETKQIYDFKDGGCFHDSESVLQSVGSIHEEVFDNVRTSDHVTKSVVKKMITEMLYDVDGRPNSKQLWSKSQNILKDAEKKLKSFKTAQPEIDPFAPADRSQTFGHPRGRVPPVLPPGIPYSQPDRFAPNNTQRPWSPHTRQKREPSATINHSREDASSPELNIEDSYETPDEMSHPTSSPATSPPDAHGPNYSQNRGITSTGYNGRPTSPEQLSETDDPSWKRSSTSHGKARFRNSAMLRPRVTDQIQGQSLTETMSGLNIGNHPELPPEPAHVEVPDNPEMESDPSKSQIAQTQTATKIDASPPTKKLVQRQEPHHLSVAEAEKWIYNRKHRQSFTPLENKVYLNELAQRDHVFLVDDAASMRHYWSDVTSVLHVLAYMLKGCDKDGMDLYFTISTSKYNSKNATGILQPIDGKSLQGTSDISSRLSSILHDYEKALRRHETRQWSLFGPKTMKPLNVYILTDALWQPQSDAEGPIRSMVETLVDLRYPPKQVGIQFIQFGKNPDCATKLEHLDSGLGLPMDIVDAEAADGNVWKMLLGAVNKWFDGDAAL